MSIFQIRSSYKLIRKLCLLNMRKRQTSNCDSKYSINMKNKPSLSRMIKEIKLKHDIILFTKLTLVLKSANIPFSQDSQK